MSLGSRSRAPDCRLSQILRVRDGLVSMILGVRDVLVVLVLRVSDVLVDLILRVVRDVESSFWSRRLGSVSFCIKKLRMKWLCDCLVSHVLRRGRYKGWWRLCSLVIYQWGT